MAESIKMEKPSVDKKWFNEPWVITLSILILGPFGLIPLWLHPKIKLHVKILISVVVMAGTVWMSYAALDVFEKMLAYYKELSATVK